MSTHHRAKRKRDGRRTIDTLLDAALYLFDVGGALEECTVEAVAAEARISAGRIYRRYDSVENFLSALLLRYLDRTHSASAEELFASLYRPRLSDTAERIVAALHRPYVAHPHVHRALDRFEHLCPHTEFTAQAPERIGEYMRKLAAVLLPHSSQFSHADPERAAMIGVLQAAGAIEEAFLAAGPEWDNTLPRTSSLFLSERSRALVAYLRAMPEAGPPRTSALQDYLG